jgi:hypothetical protein
VGDDDPFAGAVFIEELVASSPVLLTFCQLFRIQLVLISGGGNLHVFHADAQIVPFEHVFDGYRDRPHVDTGQSLSLQLLPYLQTDPVAELLGIRLEWRGALGMDRYLNRHNQGDQQNS